MSGPDAAYRARMLPRLRLELERVRTEIQRVAHLVDKAASGTDPRQPPRLVPIYRKTLDELVAGGRELEERIELYDPAGKFAWMG